MRPITTEEQFTIMQNKVRGGVVRHVLAKDEATAIDSMEYAGVLTRLRKAEDKPIRHGAGLNPAPAPFAPFTLTLTGQLPSGKNQVQLLWRRGKIQRTPNKTFTNWRAAAGLEILAQPRPALPLSAPIRLTCDYWPGNRIVRDVSGQLDALFSLLVYAHLLTNDGWVYDVIWRRHAVTATCPKVEMELSAWTIAPGGP